MKKIINIDNKHNVITEKDNIKDTLEKYPQLKKLLIKLSPEFKKLQEPALYNTLARFASFNDTAKLTGIPVAEILNLINNHLQIQESNK